MRERERVNQKIMREGSRESERERKHHVDEDLVVGAEVTDRVCRPVQAAESRSNPDARRSHGLTESSSSWPKGPIVVFWELRTFCVFFTSVIYCRDSIFFVLVLILIFIIFLLKFFGWFLDLLVHICWSMKCCPLFYFNKFF